jgi:hypothetical protein
MLNQYYHWKKTHEKNCVAASQIEREEYGLPIPFTEHGTLDGSAGHKPLKQEPPRSRREPSSV